MRKFWFFDILPVYASRLVGLSFVSRIANAVAVGIRDLSESVPYSHTKELPDN